MSSFDGTDVPDQAQVALSVPDSESHGGLSHPDNQMGTAVEAGGKDSDGDDPTGEPPTSSEDPAPPSSTAPSTPKTTEPSGPPSSDQQTKFEDQVVDLANVERAEAGCDPLRVDAHLATAAQDHSSDMAERDYFDHTTPEGLTFAERIVNAGYPTPGAENIARGQQNAEQVMKSWMDSDGHRANILNCDLTAIGVGLDENGMYWTQDFGY